MSVTGALLSRSSLLFAWLVLAAMAPGSRAGEPQSVAEVLAAAKAAAGGAAWDAVRTMHTRVRIKAAGLEGTAETFDDLLTGRNLTTFALGPITGATGWDGASGWTKDPSGQVRRMQGDDEALGAVDAAYVRCMAYWYTDRWPATVEDGGAKDDGGRQFRILRITPKGGRPFELWFDRATWLVDRIVEKGALETRTTFFSDQRTVGGRKLPFATRSTNGEPQYDQFATVDSVVFDEPVEEARFRMPAPPAADFTFPAGKTSVTIPFELINNHMYVKVMLNGRGPFTVICDTGGSNVITPTVAATLGVAPEGRIQGRGVGEKSEDFSIVKLATLSLGDVELKDQLFAVFPLESFAAIEGVQTQGLVGYEIFKRFVVRIDYEGRQLTLVLPSAFTDQGRGVAVPFRFNGSIPQVEGSIDGIPGKFDVDTGSRGAVEILRPFAEANKLKEKLGARYEGVTGWGVGGPARSVIARAHELKLGTVVIPSPVVTLSLQQKGAFSDPYVAGNVGATILKQFNLVFDYAGQRIFFEPNANASAPEPYDRSGMWINGDPKGLVVVDVIRGGPAEKAGVRAGDVITAIDGAPAAGESLVATRTRFRSSPAGTKIKLSLEREGKKRSATLVLKDLV